MQKLNLNLTKILNKDKIIEIARETGFIQRLRKINPNDFLLSLVFCSSKQLPVSLRNLVSFFDSLVSRTAIHKKFTAKATLFLKTCFQYILSVELQNCQIDISLLNPFEEVLLIDSTSWKISPELKEVFPGSGGSGSPAGCKVQLLYYFKKGLIRSIDIMKGTSPDQSYSKTIPFKISKNYLVITDLGYWCFDIFDKIKEKGAYYVSRFNIKANLWLKNENDFSQIKLEEFLKKQTANSVEFDAYINKNHKTRIVAFRVPEEKANSRRANLKKNAKKKRYEASQKSLDLCDWAILMTNCDKDIIPGEMLRSVYRIRWTIELVFKNWKSILKIDTCNVIKNKNRLLCEIYGKLILATIIHNVYQITNSYLWETEKKEISFWCVMNYIMDRSQLFYQTIKLSVYKFSNMVNSNLKKILYNCIKYHQKSRKTTLQHIEEMIGDSIPIKI